MSGGKLTLFLLISHKKITKDLGFSVPYSVSLLMETGYEESNVSAVHFLNLFVKSNTYILFTLFYHYIVCLKVGFRFKFQLF